MRIGAAQRCIHQLVRSPVLARAADDSEYHHGLSAPFVTLDFPSAPQ
jgi:hypothetical protein